MADEFSRPDNRDIFKAMRCAQTRNSTQLIASP